MRQVVCIALSALLSLGVSACQGGTEQPTESGAGYAQPPASEPVVRAEPAVTEQSSSASPEVVLQGENVVCAGNGTRYADGAAAEKAGLQPAEYGASMCPEYKMDPSWDTDQDGINACYRDNACREGADYMSPRPSQGQ